MVEDGLKAECTTLTTVDIDKDKNSICIAPIVSLDTEALGGGQTRVLQKDESLGGA